MLYYIIYSIGFSSNQDILGEGSPLGVAKNQSAVLNIFGSESSHETPRNRHSEGIFPWRYILLLAPDRSNYEQKLFTRNRME